MTELVFVLNGNSVLHLVTKVIYLHLGGGELSCTRGMAPATSPSSLAAPSIAKFTRKSAIMGTWALHGLKRGTWLLAGLLQFLKSPAQLPCVQSVRSHAMRPDKLLGHSARGIQGAGHSVLQRELKSLRVWGHLCRQWKLSKGEAGAFEGSTGEGKEHW